MNPTPTLTEYIGTNTLSQVVTQIEADIRQHPTVADKRVLLFQMLVITGQWERALKQLQTSAKLDKLLTPLAHVYGELIRAEHTRAKVFAGVIPPKFLQEPPPYNALLVQALAHQAHGQIAQADAARTDAFNQITEYSGCIYTTQGQSLFTWLTDIDSRIGPNIEIMLNGQYLWLPIAHIKSISIEPPEDLRDFVWSIAHITLKEGDILPTFIPTRYPNSEAGEQAIQLSRLSSWQEIGQTGMIGLGQRMWMTDQEDLPMLECRQIEFDEHPTVT